MHTKRRYYDWFSSYYDAFIRMHSGDRQERMRDFLVEVAGVTGGQTVVDLCTGTGSNALRLGRLGTIVVGIDFSKGMLQQARRKAGADSVHWIQGDARALPLAAHSVDCVTCAYAMYELTGRVRHEVLREVVRVLKPAGKFVLMEHLPPPSAFLRLLYFIRIYLLGSKGVRSFVGAEEDELGRFFVGVGTIAAEGGRTKAVYGFTTAAGSE
jgi:demethylmenaquinone methyltransferase/2-methoxy-6-polyprenyl-1,4-benzoquinol methylase